MAFSKQAIKLFSMLIALGLLICVLVAFLLNHWLNSPLALNDDQTLKINKGDTLVKVSHHLAQAGILDYPKLFSLYSRLTKRTKIKVGEYLIPQGTTPESLLSILESDNVITYDVVLIEGKTYKDFLNTIAVKDNIQQTLMGLSIEEQLALIDPELSHPEGWFAPNTYAYTSGESDVDILRRAYQRMKTMLAEEWENKAENLPYKNSYEALIMASIIEKETGVAYERPEIAGVFVRRLQKGIRLQTDPTIIYGLGDEYDGNIRRKHLRQKTPYNTYVIDGLPPTPIAMPGREAINAALNPKADDTLFFVAKGDGSHYFSVTLDEHNQAVRHYQIEKRRDDYRSAPQ